MKYYVIGDLHGRYDLLDKAIERIHDHVDDNSPMSKHGNEPYDYTIITLGDYIDRGPDSNKIIERLMKEQKDFIEDRFICLQGNHEAMAVESIVHDLDPDWWFGNGGDKTLYSYGHLPVTYNARGRRDAYYSLVPSDHVKWMASLPLYYEAEKQVYVHAGIPQWGMNLPSKKEDLLHKMQWMLYHPADHGGWRGKHVVHGHHQFSDGPHVWQPGSKGGGRTNLDVWAYKTGRSVIGVFDDTQLTALEFLEVKV